MTDVRALVAEEIDLGAIITHLLGHDCRTCLIIANELNKAVGASRVRRERSPQ